MLLLISNKFIDFLKFIWIKKIFLRFWKYRLNKINKNIIAKLLVL